MARSSDREPLTPADETDASADPLRPSDHVDSVRAPSEGRGGDGVTQPRLGPIGYLRFFWRQLTSMKTALFLLMLLAVAAIPGSLVPQRTSDPNGVVQYRTDNPDLFPILDKLGVFDTYSSPWFSAVYLLLFISLIGCIIPRTKHHFEALRARPPKTPARLSRLAGYRTVTIDQSGGGAGRPSVTPAAAVEAARAQLKRAGYRTEVFADSVSAERGYLRETGNLVFHAALVGVLLTVGVGGGFGYAGQRVVVEGQTFTNVLGSYDSFNPGRWFDDSQLDPFSITLDRFTTDYEEQNRDALGQALDYTADVTTRTQDGDDDEKRQIKVNSPLAIGGSNVYLLGNGYAVDVTVRDGDGDVAFRDTVPFLPQNTNLMSQGVIKVPDSSPEQLGMIGFFYPSAVDTESGMLASNYPDTLNPVLSLNVYTGDLGLDDGVPRSVYALDTVGLTEVAGADADTSAIRVTPGETADLPNGLGTVTFDGVKRFASFDVHHDPSQLWVLLFAGLSFAGLLTALFVPRRRVWVKARDTGSGLVLEYAGLARGEDPTLERAVGDITRTHLTGLGVPAEAAKAVASGETTASTSRDAESSPAPDGRKLSS